MAEGDRGRYVAHQGLLLLLLRKASCCLLVAQDQSKVWRDVILCEGLRVQNNRQGLPESQYNTYILAL